MFRELRLWHPMLNSTSKTVKNAAGHKLEHNAGSADEAE